MRYALLDNSGFAGFMRQYFPEKELHVEFIKNYPEHKFVDYVSTAQVLTAMCIFENIAVEGSSFGHNASARELTPKTAEIPKRDFSSSWVQEMLQDLPESVRRMFHSVKLWDSDSNLEYRAKILAFDLYNSYIKGKPDISENFKIPDVYTSPTYRDRRFFTELNENNGFPLNENDLHKAMFLHRGILLSALTSDIRSTIYLPYSYRGQLLEGLPPGISCRILDNETSPQFYTDVTPDKRQIMQIINEAYYKVLEQFTWTKYENFIPFIGASILSRANYNINDAIEIALEYRSSSYLSEIMNDLYENINDKMMFEYYLGEFKEELNSAGNNLRLDTSFDTLETAANLTVFWLPFGLKDPILEALKLLPKDAVSNINKFFNKVQRLEGHQMLLIDHVAALRRVKSELTKI